MKRRRTTARHAAKRAVASKKRLSLLPPTSERVLEAVFSISKDITFGMTEEELVGRYARMLVGLFRGRSLCIRAVDPHTLTLSSLFAEGRLRRGLRKAALAIRPTAVAKTKLIPRGGDVRLQITSTYVRVFEDTHDRGVAIPLVASGGLYGLLNVEYPTAVAKAGLDALIEQDETVLIPLANQLSVALRNKKLAQETMFLRDYQAKLIEEANALIFAVDREARVTIFNRALADLTGFPPRAILGRDLREWLAEHGRSDLASLIFEGLAGHTPSAVEVRIPSRSGQEIRAAFNVAAIPAADGDIEAVVAIGQDLTRLKALEHQVIQAEKLATLGQLAAGVVHEINNPLTSITVYADYLKKKLERDGADPADVDRMGKILDGAERILRFSRDLVAYARPSGDVDAVSVNEVVEQSLSFCEHILKKAEARVELSLGELPPIHGIRGQLQQVFINLVTNASHAMNSGGGTIRVATRGRGELEVEVDVADDGVGIKAEDMPRIFEPFFTTKLPGKGTGLGLSIVKNIVDRHGGRVEVRSAPGQGASFKVILPTKHRKTGNE
jgi:two-component system, NtrC family, sensor kinase